MGPDYAVPRADVAEAWLDVMGPPDARPEAEARWWQGFGDPALDALVEQALAQNLTLRQAGLRVLQARALRGITVGRFFPQSQAVFAEASRNRISENTLQGAGDGTFDDYSVGLEAAWELDFWGRFRRGVESADAALQASVADYDAVLVLVAADVASSYMVLRSLQEQLAFTRSNVQAQEDTLALTRIRFEAGAVSELDVATAQATLSNTLALLPQLEDELRATTMSLCVLLGRTPSDLAAALGDGGVPEAPPEIAAGIPAELLRRRPDVRRAERIAAALSAQVGVTAANLYPSFALFGMTGFRATTIETPSLSPTSGDLFDADSFQGFFGLDVNWPILNYGRIRNDVRAADALFEEAAVAYQETVLRAAAEVETGLSSFLRGRERAAHLANSVSAAERAAELSLIQYRQGAADFLRVNQAQVDLVERQNSLVLARASIGQAVIATYRALGGGWETRCGREFVPQETIDALRERTDWGDILAPEYEQGTDLLFFERPADDPQALIEGEGGGHDDGY